MNQDYASNDALEANLRLPPPKWHPPLQVGIFLFSTLQILGVLVFVYNIRDTFDDLPVAFFLPRLLRMVAIAGLLLAAGIFTLMKREIAIVLFGLYLVVTGLAATLGGNPLPAVSLALISMIALYLLKLRRVNLLQPSPRLRQWTSAALSALGTPRSSRVISGLRWLERQKISAWLVFNICVLSFMGNALEMGKIFYRTGRLSAGNEDPYVELSSLLAITLLLLAGILMLRNNPKSQSLFFGSLFFTTSLTYTYPDFVNFVALGQIAAMMAYSMYFFRANPSLSESAVAPPESQIS